MMSNIWLQLKKQSPMAQYNFVCLPFAGGFSEYFLTWHKCLPGEFQLCPIQLPGRSYRWQEPAYQDIDVLLADIMPTLEMLSHELPYILFGHSMGGYLSYKLCEAMQTRGLPLPKLLVVSSVPAPQYWLSRRLLSDFSEQDFSDFFFKLGGIKPELLGQKQFIQSQMILLRKDIILCESCAYTGPAHFPFPILAMGGIDDEYVDIKMMQGWKMETGSEFHLKAYPGGHFYLNDSLPLLLQFILESIL